MATKAQLQHAVDVANRTYLAGRNDDDQVQRMCTLRDKCEGYNVWAGYDTYELVTQEEYDKRMHFKYAKELIGDDSHEYNRGICELLGEIYPVKGQELAERSQDIATLLDCRSGIWSLQ